MTETRVHEAGVVYAELADKRIEGQHLGRVRWRNAHRLLRGEDVELIWIEDQPPPVAADANRLPVILDGAGADLVDVDDAGVADGAVADQAVGRAGRRCQVNREPDAVVDVGRTAVGETAVPTDDGSGKGPKIEPGMPAPASDD